MSYYRNSLLGVNSCMNLIGTIAGLLILSVFLVSVTSCTANMAVDEWSSYRHDSSNTGTSSSKAAQNFLLWKYYTGAKIFSTAATANGIVYTCSHNGLVYALNSQTGALLWNFNWTGQIEASPLVVDDVLYVEYLYNGKNGYIRGFDATTGAGLWAGQNDVAGVSSTPAVVNDVIYNIYTNGVLYASNTKTLNVLWSFHADGDVFSSPAVVNGALYFGSLKGSIYALNVANGDILWTLNVTNAIYASPAVADNKVYVNSDNGTLYALDAQSGKEIWRASFGTGDHADDSPAVAYGIVYVGSRNGYYAFNATTGQQIWFFTSPYTPRQYTGYVYSSPIVASGVVYFGSADNYIFALDAYTGCLIWSYETGGTLLASPTIANGILYIGSCDGYLYAFGGEDNTFVNPTPNLTSVPTMPITSQPLSTATATTSPNPTVTPSSTPIASPSPSPSSVTTPTPKPTNIPTPTSTLKPKTTIGTTNASNSALTEPTNPSHTQTKNGPTPTPAKNQPIKLPGVNNDSLLDNLINWGIICVVIAIAVIAAVDQFIILDLKERLKKEACV